MSMISVGDIARSLLLQHGIASAKARMNALTGALASGRQADIAQALHGDMAPLAAIEGTLARISGWRSAGDALERQGAAMQAALGAVSAIGDSVSETLLRLSAGGQAADISIATHEALDAFEAAVGILNAESGGRSVFAGKRSDLPALAGPASILRQLVAATSGASSAAEVESRVMAWFDDPAGFATGAYLGGEPADPVPIGPGQAAAFGVTAMDPAIRTLLAGLAMAALPVLGVLADRPVEQQALGLRAGQSLNGSSRLRAETAARVGIVQQRLDTAAARNASEETALGIARSGVVAADPFATAAELEATRVQIETLYAVTARLSGLSLVAALR